MILTGLGVDFESAVKIVGDRRGKDQSYLLSSDRLRELNWSDRITLEEGLVQTIAWARDYLEPLMAAPQHYIHKP